MGCWILVQIQHTLGTANELALHPCYACLQGTEKWCWILHHGWASLTNSMAASLLQCFYPASSENLWLTVRLRRSQDHQWFYKAVMGSPTILSSGHEVTAEFRRSQFVTPVAALSIACMGVTKLDLPLFWILFVCGRAWEWGYQLMTQDNSHSVHFSCLKFTLQSSWNFEFCR